MLRCNLYIIFVGFVLLIYLPDHIIMASQDNAFEKAKEQHDQMDVNLWTERKSDTAKKVVVRENIVTAYDAQSEPDAVDVRKLRTIEVSKRRTREVLVLNRIVEDFSFTFGEDVQQWEHVEHNGSDFYIGRRARDILIVQHKQDAYLPLQNLQIECSNLKVFQYWNQELEIQEGVLLLPLVDKIRLYRYSAKVQQYMADWELHVGTGIAGLTYFKVDTRQYLAISTNNTFQGGNYVINIYEFDLESKEFWIVQHMQLPDPCYELVVLDTGRDIILAVVQTDSAAIYMFNAEEAVNPKLIHFEFQSNFQSPHIRHIAGFVMGGQSFLALGGLKPQILLYEQGKLKPKTILDSNFGLVELFLPIPVRTYRDDLILLVQHRVEFSTHMLVTLETLIWNGDFFETSIPVPCELGEHIEFGVRCMLDMQKDTGLRGAALLRRGVTPFLLVPRHNAESGMFQLHTQLLAKNSEFLDLQETFKFLEEWMHEQDTLTEQAEMFVNVFSNEFSYNKIVVPNLIFNGQFGDLYVNKFKWTDMDLNANIHELLISIRQLDQELNAQIRQKRGSVLDMYEYEFFDIDLVDAKELRIDSLNHVPYYIQNGSLNFSGLLNLKSVSFIQENLSRHARQAMLAELHINLQDEFEIKFINDLKWDELKNNFTFINEVLKLNNLIMQGELIAEQQVKLNMLNGLNFPDEYVWSYSPTTTIIQAEKIFERQLSVNVIDTNGIINGVSPIDVVTLFETQNWNGSPTFAMLEISEMLEVNGSVHGYNHKSGQENPTLLETREIKANCYFKNINVSEFISLPSDHYYEQIFQQISAYDEDIIRIDDNKIFTYVEFPIDFNVIDNAISGFDIYDFIPLHSTQTLRDLTNIIGHVYFHEIQVEGNYNEVDAKIFQAQALRIDEIIDEPTIQMNFLNPQLIDALQFAVSSSLNDITLAENYYTLKEDLVVPQANFDLLNIQVVEVASNILGCDYLNTKNITNFLTKSIQKYRNATNNIYLNYLTLSLGLKAVELNGIKAVLLLNFLQRIDELPLLILAEQIQVESIYVTGTVKLKANMNSITFESKFLNQLIWLNRRNYLMNHFTFEKAMFLMSGFNLIGTYNGFNMTDFLNNVIFDITKHRIDKQALYIQSSKIFTGNVRILGRIILNSLHGITFNLYANKYNYNEFVNDMEIHGKLNVNHIEVHTAINEFRLNDQLDTCLKYKPQIGAFVQLSVIPLIEQLRLNDLTVLGWLRNIPTTVEAYFNDLFYYNMQQLNIIKGNNTFNGRVKILSSAYIEKLNDINLKFMLANIVTIDKSFNINNSVSFNKLVSFLAVFDVFSNMHISKLSSCKLQNWTRKTIRVDQNFEYTEILSFTPGAFDDNNLTVSCYNFVDLAKIVSLPNAQNLNTLLIVNELFLKDIIEVQHYVNNVNLLEKYNNTLMQNFDNQLVFTSLIFKSVFILNDLKILTPTLGNKELRNLTSLYKSRSVLKSSIYFQQLTVRSVHSSARISGINFPEWYGSSLWHHDPDVQFITGNWIVRNLQIASQNISGNPSSQRMLSTN